MPKSRRSFSTRYAIPVSLGAFLPGLLFAWLLGVEGLDQVIWVCGGWFPSFAIFAYVARLFTPPQGRILFLRRFHRERPPQFPVSRIFAMLGGQGFETVTLADTTVTSDEASLVPIAAVLAAFLAWFIVVPVSVVAALIVFGIAQAVLPPVVAVAVTIVAAVPALLPLRGRTPFFIAAMKSLMERIARWLINRSPKVLLDLRRQPKVTAEAMSHQRLRRRWQLGVAVIRCSDEQWKEVVDALIRSSVVVCIDISFPSTNIMTEISLLSALKDGASVIWMASADVEFPPVAATPQGYSILGAQFVGAFTKFTYPGGDNSALYELMDGGRAAKRIKAEAERLLALFPTA